jgi:cyanophycinase-like exopeptidase
LIVLSLPGIAAAAPLRLLFIGNSLTYVNDVPALVQAIGKANGEKIETRMVAYPDYSLEDHWNGGDARRALAEGGWSFVVMQQGPSSQPDSRVLLVEYAKRFGKEAPV